jgi:hypothetical protein
MEVAMARLNIHVENIKIAGSGDKVISAEEVRKHLVAAIHSIPTEKLHGFRGGQVTIIK